MGERGLAPAAASSGAVCRPRAAAESHRQAILLGSGERRSLTDEAADVVGENGGVEIVDSGH